MELQKAEKPLEFKYGDVTFFIKPRATEHDIFTTVMIGEVKAGGQVTLKRSDFNECVLRNFIVGWAGVTMDGQPVPYSWDALVSGWPKSESDNIFVALLNFIFEHTDYNKKDAHSKKA